MGNFLFSGLEIGGNFVVLFYEVLQTAGEILESDGRGLKVTIRLVAHEDCVFLFQQAEVVDELNIGGVGDVKLALGGEELGQLAVALAFDGLLELLS